MELLTACWTAPFSPDTLGSFGPAEAVAPKVGDVLVLRVAANGAAPGASSDGGGPGPLEALTAALRRRHPGAPVAVWIPDAPTDCVIDAVREALGARVRAILGGVEADGECLRQQLTHPAGLSSFILRWASDAGYLPEGTVQQEIQTLLDAPPNVRTLQRLAGERREAARTWRSRLQNLGLPTPHAWLGLAHALHVAFYLQRNHLQPLRAHAERLGFSDVRLMAHRFQHVFGMAPGEVRALLGAEPLLHRWFQGAGREVRR